MGYLTAEIATSCAERANELGAAVVDDNIVSYVLLTDADWYTFVKKHDAIARTAVGERLTTVVRQVYQRFGGARATEEQFAFIRTLLGLARDEVAPDEGF